MVEIKWIITDDIKDIKAEKFDKEWGCIDGYFELLVNENSVGDCPDRELFFGEEGFEDILFWFEELIDSLVEIEKGNTRYKVTLITMNLAEVIVEKENQNLIVSFGKIHSDEPEWSEIVSLKEWYSEIISSADKFIENIREINPDLLNVKRIKKLTRRIEELSDLKKFI